MALFLNDTSDKICIDIIHVHVHMTAAQYIPLFQIYFYFTTSCIDSLRTLFGTIKLLKYSVTLTSVSIVFTP